MSARDFIAKPVGPPPPPAPQGPPHEHVWTIGHVATEGVYGATRGVCVVYLVCQCGATKRSIPE